MYGFEKTLPARVGDTVYVLDRKSIRVVPMKVHSYHLFGSRRDVVELVRSGSDTEVHTRWKVNQFGKVIFANEEQAAQALFEHR